MLVITILVFLQLISCFLLIWDKYLYSYNCETLQDYVVEFFYYFLETMRNFIFNNTYYFLEALAIAKVVNLFINQIWFKSLVVSCTYYLYFVYERYNSNAYLVNLHVWLCKLCLVIMLFKKYYPVL